MILYRATTPAHYTGPWSCWTPHRASAEAYWDNPGFGGPHLLAWTGDPDTLGPRLDLTGMTDRQAVRHLLAAIDLPDYDWVADTVGWVYEAWEEYTAIRTAVRQRFTWIVHDDSYPAACETWVYLGYSPLSARCVAQRPSYASRALQAIQEWRLSRHEIFDMADQWPGYNARQTAQADPDGSLGIFVFDDGSLLQWDGQHGHLLNPKGEEG